MNRPNPYFKGVKPTRLTATEVTWTQERLIEHYRALIYQEEVLWNCEHKDYTDEEVLEWAKRANKRRTVNA